MIHSLIAWDSSFRNFYYLIDALLTQNYSKDDFELIFVEQRTETMNILNQKKEKLKSLTDRKTEIGNNINLKIIYLEHDTSKPYHLGLCVNHGMRYISNKTKYVSVMDGDLLLPPDFLQKLEEFHNDNPNSIINLYRKMAKYPIGVKKNNWKNAIVKFDRCLEACESPRSLIPKRVSNKGPLISTSINNWRKIQGYDEHPIWSTGLSRLGQDVTTRLEILIGKRSVVLPNCFCVHPWHPSGFHRYKKSEKKMLEIQKDLIDWCLKNNEDSWKKRLKITNDVYSQNKELLDEMIFKKYRIPSSSSVRDHNRLIKILHSIQNKFFPK